MTKQNRDFFRLEYPPAERPRLIAGSFEAVVLNISEGGCLVEVSGPAVDVFRPVGAHISGTIVFSNHERIDVSGEIARIIDSATVALKFVNGLSFAKMMSEHRRIREKYG